MSRPTPVATCVLLACFVAGVSLVEPPFSPFRVRPFRTAWNFPGLNFQLQLGTSAAKKPASMAAPDVLGSYDSLPDVGRGLAGNYPAGNYPSRDYPDDAVALHGPPGRTLAPASSDVDVSTAASAGNGGSGGSGSGGFFRSISDFGNQITRQMMRRSGENDGIVFNLYTRQNKADPERLFANDTSSISSSKFNPDKLTKMVIHGFNSKQGPGSGGDFLKDALLEVGDLNVITVDWSAVDPKIYPVDVSSTVPEVGAGVAELIRVLTSAAGARLDSFHLIGHSLGAHIAGAAGSLALGPRKAGRITGLDPAGPMFEGRDATSRLDPSDAGFVDAIHTDGGLLGIVQPVAHVDFYVEGGRHTQPSCGLDVIGFCSHCFAYEIMDDAIRNPGDAVATLCTSWESYTKGECDDKPKDVLGLHTSRKSRGSFFLHTNLVPSLPLRMVGQPISAAGDVSRAYSGGQSLSPRC